MNLTKNIAENINALLEAHTISGSEFARAIGVTESAVHLWRHGQRMPRDKQIEAICKFFDIGVQELMTPGGWKRADPNA